MNDMTHAPANLIASPGQKAGPRWFHVVGLALLVWLALLPFDGVVAQAASQVRLGGDVRRTLETLQQFGDLASLVIVGLIIWLQDAKRRAALLDLALAAGATGLLCFVAKILIGRPRPGLGEPYVFLLPWRTFDMPILWADPSQAPQVVTIHAWNLAGPRVSQLWSMPSSHTSAATALAIFLILTYPRLKPLALGMVIIVSLMRVLTTAHYPTDVVAGLLAGWLASWPVVSGQWGQRLARSVGFKSPSTSP